MIENRKETEIKKDQPNVSKSSTKYGSGYKLSNSEGWDRNL